ncbi:PDR/VanB family oxidoreductase [Mumia flava]|uniref:PDR/VanB family oxidoreductase n=1 Tax=Mumia flava TaxID=1348852 RepID=UPI000A593D63|nr:PDR/VanB family oxidoreductase [Mumia flava]
MLTSSPQPFTATAAPTGDADSRTTVTVVAKRLVADGVCELTLADPYGRRLPDWTPGSHIDLVLPGDHVRQYSLCGDRRDATTYTIAVLREPDGRGGSAAVHDDLEPGDLLGIGGPRNHFRLSPAPHHLFIAGGIGITPILAMVRAVEAMGGSWELLYGGRSRSSMAYLEELEAYGSRVRVVPQDAEGLLDLGAAMASLPEGTRVSCCGPAPLLAAVEARGTMLPAGSVRTERFVAADQPAPVRSTSFEIELAASGRVVEVAPGRPVIDALADAGVHVLTSCRQGICGTCETGVVAGVPDHRDALLSDDERERGDTMFVCVSRACSDRLVLDL